MLLMKQMEEIRRKMNVRDNAGCREGKLGGVARWTIGRREFKLGVRA